MKRLAYENVTGEVSHIDGMDTVVQIHQHSVINSPPLFPPTNLALSTALTYCTCHHAIRFNSQQELSHNPNHYVHTLLLICHSQKPIVKTQQRHHQTVWLVLSGNG